MENKINIAEILKDCPKGMELYSPLCGECKLYDVNDYNIRIETSNKDALICLYHDGRYCANGEIMLFPKGKTTWEGFTPPCKFKVGDKITDKNKFIYRITEVTDKGYKLHDLKTTFITFEEADLYFVKVVDVFDITTLIPFESRVLVRSDKSMIWKPAIYGIYKDSLYWTVGGFAWIQCVPYKDNEHLLGTTNDCDNYYKNW